MINMSRLPATYQRQRHSHPCQQQLCPAQQDGLAAASWLHDHAFLLDSSVMKHVLILASFLASWLLLCQANCCMTSTAAHKAKPPCTPSTPTPNTRLIPACRILSVTCFLQHTKDSRRMAAELPCSAWLLEGLCTVAGCPSLAGA
jgi:hypothetical protein